AGHKIDLPPGPANPEAEIQVLATVDEALAEAATLLEQVATDQHGGPRNRLDLLVHVGLVRRDEALVEPAPDDGQLLDPEDVDSHEPPHGRHDTGRGGLEGSVLAPDGGAQHARIRVLTKEMGQDSQGTRGYDRIRVQE